MTEQKTLMYFGCIRTLGHYLWQHEGSYRDSRLIRINGVNTKILNFIDGTFTPGSTSQQGLYNESIVPPFRIVSWHDYTVDKRPGSNSNLIGIGYESAEQMIDDAYQKFPSVMNRQERPKKLTS